MSLFTIFTKTTSINESEKINPNTVAAPKQLDRIEQQLKDLEERIIQELRKGGCRVIH